jgi:hypothetical protein
MSGIGCKLMMGNGG